MKTRTILIKIFLIVGLVMISINPASSADASTDHAAHVGELIHESSVDGHKMTYHLLGLPNRQESHLVVYIVTPDGISVEDAKVGYLVKGPDNSSQKAMAMRMDKAFGADINFSQAGDYTIKVKAVIGEIKIFDNFAYKSQ